MEISGPLHPCYGVYIFAVVEADCSVLFNMITLSLTPVTMCVALFLSFAPYCLQCLLF